jgi:hypothetical protein
MRFSSKTFKKRASRKAKKTRKMRKQKGGDNNRKIPEEAVIVNPMKWSDRDDRGDV